MMADFEYLIMDFGQLILFVKIIIVFIFIEKRCAFNQACALRLRR